MHLAVLAFRHEVHNVWMPGTVLTILELIPFDDTCSVDPAVSASCSLKSQTVEVIWSLLDLPGVLGHGALTKPMPRLVSGAPKVLP